jgi:hypothetical protein
VAPNDKLERPSASDAIAPRVHTGPLCLCRAKSHASRRPRELLGGVILCVRLA